MKSRSLTTEEDLLNSGTNTTQQTAPSNFTVSFAGSVTQ